MIRAFISKVLRARMRKMFADLDAVLDAAVADAAAEIGSDPAPEDQPDPSTFAASMDQLRARLDEREPGWRDRKPNPVESVRLLYLGGATWRYIVYPHDVATAVEVVSAMEDAVEAAGGKCHHLWPRDREGLVIWQ